MFKETFVKVYGRTSVTEGIQEIVKNDQNNLNHPYSLIFIDVNMPEISGIEGAR